MTTLRQTPALSNNGGVKVNDGTYGEEVAANVVALWGRVACWLDNVGGTPNKITANANPPLTATPTRPMAFWLVPATDNTSNAQINIDSQGFFDILDAAAAGLSQSSLKAGSLYLLLFDGTQYRVIFSSSGTNVNTAPDAIFRDIKTLNTSGGGFVAGAWQPRDLNDPTRNVLSGASLDPITGQFTLQAGVYYIKWRTPASGVNRNQSRLQNITLGSTVDYSDSSLLSGTGPVHGQTVISINTATVFRIEHKCQTTNNTNGFGVEANVGTEEIYTVVEIWQVGSQPNAVQGFPGGAITWFVGFNSSTTDADPGAGQAALNNATQNTATTLFLDLLDFGLTDVTALIDSFDVSTASVKGSLRLTKNGDPTKWLVFNVTSRVTATGYRKLVLVNVGSSSSSPFVSGDKLILTYTPVGPKGDKGDTGATGSIGTLAANTVGFVMINGIITQNAPGDGTITFAIKQQNGSDPSSSNPVYIVMRNTTLTDGGYQLISITTATSFTFSSGSTTGVSANDPFKIWLFVMSTGEIGAVQTRSGNDIYELGQFPEITTLAEGGAGAADSAMQPYSTTARSSLPYQPIGYLAWNSGLATPGTWVAADKIQLFGHQIPLPGTPIKRRTTQTGGVATGTTLMVADNTIPTGAEGDAYMSLAVTGTDATNMYEIESQVQGAVSAGARFIATLFRDNAGAGSSAKESSGSGGGNSTMSAAFISHREVVKTVASTTWQIRAGTFSGTFTFNGESSAARYNGTCNSYAKCIELQT